MDNLSGNAFTVINRYTKLDYFKFVVFFIPAIVRLVFFILFMLLCGISSHILYYIRMLHNPSDYSTWKKFYITIPIFMLRCAIFSMGFYKIKIVNKSESSLRKNDKQHPILLLTPHSSIFDYFAVVMLGLPPFVARYQVKQNRFISKLAALGEPIIVKREERVSCKNAIEVIKERAKEEQILLFPEGTNTNRQMIIRYRLGAFIPGFPVQPVYIQFSNHSIDSYSWTWEGPSEYMGFFLTSLKWKSSMTLVKLPVYYPNEEEKTNPALYSQNVQKYVTQQINARLSFYTYDDVSFLKLALTAGIPRSPIGLKFLKLCRRVTQFIKNTPFLAGRDEPQIINGSPTNGVVKNNSEQNGIRKKIKMFGLRRSESSLSLEGKVENYWEESDISIIEFMNEIVQKYLDAHKKETETIIESKQDLIRLFSFQDVQSQLEQSSVIEDFLTTLRGHENSVSTTRELTLFVMLCDTRRYHIWDRIREIFLFLNNRTNEHEIDKCVLSLSQFKTLIWLLLGLEAAVISDNHFKDIVITFDYMHENLVQMFTKAVEENAPDLINT